MRIDHHAYQRATRISSAGFGLQLMLGLILLIFSRLNPADTVLFQASTYILVGLLPWLGLILLFKQHQLERIEALELDEVASGGSAFETADDELRVAARRLRKMHSIWLPVASLLIAIAMSGIGTMILFYMRRINDLGEEGVDLLRTTHTGWAIALCLGFTVLSFIMSRFVAGMAKLDAWQNLRGGAGFMVGNSLVCLLVSVGIGFRFFNDERVNDVMPYVLAIVLLLQAAEIVLNFVLNLYRPRIPGEYPRPAFDSRVLSHLAAPDNFVRSINEAVNYQFGFDITSSWGYQLLTRSVVWLVGGSIVTVVVLNMIVIVEPNQQAIRLGHGAIVGERTYSSGPMLKLPWPLQTAETFETTRVRTLWLTAKRERSARNREGIHLFIDDVGKLYDTELEPFLVGPHESEGDDTSGVLQNAAAAPVVGSTAVTSLALVDCEIAMQYRVKSDEGLIDYLNFASDDRPRRARFSIREQMLRLIALRQISQYLATMSIDDVLAARRSELSTESRTRIQAAFDERSTGVEVVSVDFLHIRPHGEAAEVYEQLSMAVQQRMRIEEVAELNIQSEYVKFGGSSDRVDQLLATIETYSDAEDAYTGLLVERGEDDPEVLALRDRRDEAKSAARQFLLESGGSLTLRIDDANRGRWQRIFGARTQANRVSSQSVAYNAFPELYRQREIMRVYEELLPGLNVTVVGIDPDRLDIQFEAKELDPLTQIADTLGPESLGSIEE